MRFLVTGGAGFIGSHIVETLLKKGIPKGLSPKGTLPEVKPEDIFVRVLDNFSSGKCENLSFVQGLSPQNMKGLSPKGTDPEVKTKGTLPNFANFELIEGDIRDYPTCLQACNEIDYVLHQAALRSVPKSMEDPYKYNEVNINGTLNMLKAAKECKVKRFIFASSSSIYGDTHKFPEKESDQPLLISPYALTKLAGEYYCRIFSQNYGLETVSLRYFNVFGPRQALDDEYAVVIPKFINSILNDQSPPVHGNGRQSRDFTYIDNVVEANILAATKGLSPKGTDPEVAHELFNVANGKDNTILQLVDTLNKIIYPVRKKISNGVGKSIKPIFTPPRPGDVLRTLADISKIKEILGYKPLVDFEEGLRITVEWFAKKEYEILNI